jgi:hypothetical protein
MAGSVLCLSAAYIITSKEDLLKAPKAASLCSTALSLCITTLLIAVLVHFPVGEHNGFNAEDIPTHHQ